MLQKFLGFFRGKSQNNLVKLQVNAIAVKDIKNSIFERGTASSLPQSVTSQLKEKLNKNFQKKVSQSRVGKLAATPQSEPAAADCHDLEKQQRKIDNLFEFQRAVAICKFTHTPSLITLLETAMKKYDFASEEFLLKIQRGKYHSISNEELEIFTRILPRQAEVQRLKEALLNEGVDSL